METVDGTLISMQCLIEKLTPEDKAVLIHVVEIHDKFCHQCKNHVEPEAKENSSGQKNEVEIKENSAPITSKENALPVKSVKGKENNETEPGSPGKSKDKTIDATVDSTEPQSDIPLLMTVNEDDNVEMDGNDLSTPQQEKNIDIIASTRSEKSDMFKDNCGKKHSEDEDHYQKGNLKTIRSAVQIFKKWLKQIGINPDFEYLAVDKIIQYIHQMENTQSEENRNVSPTTCTMSFIKSSIFRHLNSHPYNRRISSDYFMMHANKGNDIENIHIVIEEQRMKNLISQEDMRKIYSSGVFGNGEIYTPRSLLYKVWFEISLHFGNFLKKTSSKLRREELKIATDERGRLFCTFCLNEMDGERWMDAPRIYGTAKNPCCPLKSILLYISHLNPNNELLFQQPTRFAFHVNKANWYTSVKLGQNTLKRMMKVISQTAGLSKNYPNISIRDTACDVLNSAGLWDDEEYKKYWKRKPDFDIVSRKEEIFFKLQEFAHGSPQQISDQLDEVQEVNEGSSGNSTILQGINVKCMQNEQPKKESNLYCSDELDKVNEGMDFHNSGVDTAQDDSAVNQTLLYTNQNSPMNKGIVPQPTVSLQNENGKLGNTSDDNFKDNEIKNQVAPVCNLNQACSGEALFTKSLAPVTLVPANYKLVVPHTSLSVNQCHVSHMLLNTKQCIPLMKVTQSRSTVKSANLTTIHKQISSTGNINSHETDSVFPAVSSIQSCGTKQVKSRDFKTQTGVTLQDMNSSGSKTCKVEPMIRGQLLSQQGQIPGQESVITRVPCPDPQLSCHITNQKRTFVFINKNGQKTIKTSNNLGNSGKCVLSVPSITGKNDVPAKTVSECKFRGTVLKTDLTSNVTVTSNANDGRLCSSANKIIIPNSSELISNTVDVCQKRTDQQSDKKFEDKLNSYESDNSPIISYDEKKKMWVCQNVDEFLKGVLPQKEESTESNVGPLENVATSTVETNEVQNLDKHETTCIDQKVQQKTNNHYNIQHNFGTDNSNFCYGSSVYRNKENVLKKGLKKEKCAETKAAVNVSRNEIHDPISCQPGIKLEKSSCSTDIELVMGDEKSMAPEKILETMNDNSDENNNNTNVLAAKYTEPDMERIEFKQSTTGSSFPSIFQEKFTTRRERIAKILQKIQEDSKQVEKIRSKINSKEITSTTDFNDMLLKGLTENASGCFTSDETENRNMHNLHKTADNFSVSSKNKTQSCSESSNALLGNSDINFDRNRDRESLNIVTTDFVNFDNLENKDKLSNTVKTDENCCQTEHMYKGKTYRYVFKRRKCTGKIETVSSPETTQPCIKSSFGTNEGNIVKTAVESEKSQSPVIKLALRKKQGNEYEIVKTKHLSEKMIYSPLFSNDCGDNSHQHIQNLALNKTEDKYQCSRKRKTAAPMQDKTTVSNSDSYFEESEFSGDKTSSSITHPLPFKKRIKMDNNNQMESHDSRDELVNYKLSEKEVISDSDCSLTDEPSLMKCVNAAAYTFCEW